MIVVEGPDGAGKTTLVETLLEVFGDDLTLGTRGTKNRDDLWKVTKSDTYRAIEEALGAPFEGARNDTRIWDRLYWSEFVYWDLVGRDKPQFNEQDQILIPRMIAALKAPVIWCLPLKATVMENIESEENHQMPGVRERADQIFNRYSQMRIDFKMMPAEIRNYTMTYDYTGERAGNSLDEIIRRIEGYIHNKKARLS